MQNVSLRDHPARGESGTWWITNLKLRLEEAARYRGAAIGKPGKTGWETSITQWGAYY